MGAQGTADLDFGAFPGKSDASIVVTGQAGIAAGSLVEAWIRPVDTADHLADEHMVETLKVFAASIVAGTGFTIYGFNTSEIHEPLMPPAAVRGRETAGQPTTDQGSQVSTDPLGGVGGTGTRLYGVWKVAWVWNALARLGVFACLL